MRYAPTSKSQDLRTLLKPKPIVQWKRAVEAFLIKATMETYLCHVANQLEEELQASQAHYTLKLVNSFLSTNSVWSSDIKPCCGF